MLKRLKAKNFRKLVDTELTFGPGLTAVRGSNEAGKSTLLEAIAYALHGAKACREAIDDVVTWGEPKNSLKVELDIETDNVTYTVKRSPTGAEVWFSGRSEPDVVGQTEVTNFMSRILGMDASAMNRLVFASQGGIRGALDEGPTATAEMIEKLADLTQIDDVLQLIVEHLPTGSTAGAEARLQQLQDQLADLKPVEKQDWAAKKAEHSERVAHLETRLAQAEHEAAQITASVETKKREQQEAARLQARKTQLAADLERATTRLLGLQTWAQKEVIDTDMLTHEIEQLANLASEVRLYEATAPFLPLPEVHWEGSKALFDDIVESLNSELANLKQGVSEAKTRIRVLEAQRVSSSVCGFCNQDVSRFPEVAAKNAQIDAEVRDLQSEVCSKAEVIQTITNELSEYMSVVEVGIKRLSGLNRAIALGKVVLDDLTYPPGATWVGPVQDEAALERLPALQKSLKTAQEHNKEVDAARIQLPLAQESVERLRVELESVVVVVVDEEDFERIKQLASEANAKMQGVKRDLQEARQALTRLESAEANEQQMLALYEQAKANLTAQITQARAEIEEIGFNNELLKAVRAARPIVAEAVWNMVLSAVSTYFSELRQEECVVQRQGKIFTVNGKGIGGLSGSTKDILGLAIRLALTKTFLPNASFLLLDEISAACDPERTAVMLGFLQATGVPQTILVTHELESEAVADNMIQL